MVDSGWSRETAARQWHGSSEALARNFQKFITRISCIKVHNKYYIQLVSNLYNATKDYNIIFSFIFLTKYEIC